MKKKQFKRLEKLLVHLVESTINNGAELHDIKKDQRSIQDANAGSWGEVAHMLDERLELLDRDDEAYALSTIAGFLESIDGQMAPLSHAAAQWSRSQVRSGPGIEEFAAASNDLPEPKAPEGPDPTTADSWAGRLGEDIQKEAVGRFEDSVGRITPTTNAEDVARQGDPNPPKPGETVARLQAGNNILAQENRNLLEQLDRQAATIRKWREKARTLEEKQINDAAHNNEKIRLIMHELTGNDRSNLTLPWAVRDCIMELQKQVAQEGEAASIYRSKMLENERQLKLAVGEAQTLSDDASMDRFIKWVGNRGWKWIQGHRGTINERLDRLDRERAYNQGNNKSPIQFKE